MTQKWYEKASVQTGIATGFFALIVAIISICYNNKVQLLEDDVANSNLQIQLLDSKLAPFKAIALEHFTGTEAQALAQLASHLNNLGDAITDLKNYTNVATLNVVGLPFVSDGTINVSTPISQRMGSYVTLNKITNHYDFKCDDSAIAGYKELITTNPNFPFSYYFLAKCLMAQNNSDWKEYAENAMKILNTTTTIDGHNTNHNEALKDIKGLLAGS